MSTKSAPASMSVTRLCDDLTTNGAILTLPAVPLRRVLVGEIRWLQEGRAAIIFPAFGESVDDAHALTFDEIEVHGYGVCFHEGARVAALLTTIAKCPLDDPDDYRVAWSLWREVRPLRQPLIDAAFDRVAELYRQALAAPTAPAKRRTIQAALSL